MATLDENYISELVEKYQTYKSPNDTQKLIMLLGSKTRTEEEEDKKLKILVNAEKKLTQLVKARQAARDVLNKDKSDKRKIETRKKILWGSALKSAAQDNADIAKLAVYLFDNGYIADKDKDAVIDDYNAFIPTQSDDFINF